jgi:hypothetical protein
MKERNSACEQINNDEVAVRKRNPIQQKIQDNPPAAGGTRSLRVSRTCGYPPAGVGAGSTVESMEFLFM